MKETKKSDTDALSGSDPGYGDPEHQNVQNDDYKAYYDMENDGIEEGEHEYDMADDQEDQPVEGAGYYSAYENSYSEGGEAEDAGLFSTPARTVTLVGSFLLVLAVGVTLAWLLGQRSATAAGGAADPSGSAASGNLPVAVRVGALPPDFTLTDAYTGAPVKLSSLRGKPVWVNFWASWCPPCKAEMPEMKQRYERYKDKGLVILGVDLGEDSATVKQFTKLNGYDWTFVLDSNQQVGQQYSVTGIPTHIFVDKTGVIRAVQVGGISGNLMDADLAKIIQ